MSGVEVALPEAVESGQVVMMDMTMSIFEQDEFRKSKRMSLVIVEDGDGVRWTANLRNIYKNRYRLTIRHRIAELLKPTGAMGRNNGQ